MKAICEYYLSQSHPDAIWRGYFQTAYRMMEIFAEGKLGMARISYQLNDEGWCYRTARGKSRAIERDDVRSVIANWKEYSGFILYLIVNQ